MGETTAKPAQCVPGYIFERMLGRSTRALDGCLVSTYAPGNHGYPSIAWAISGVTTSMLVHRAAWIFINGPIAAGVTVDHLCHNRLCFEITHLRLLSNLENARRTSGRNWPLGQCINGHGAEHWRPKGDGGITKGYCRPCYTAGMAEKTRQRRERTERLRREQGRERLKNQNVSKTHCPQGHPYDVFTTRGRACRRCYNEQSQRYKQRVRARKREAALLAAPEPLPRPYLRPPAVSGLVT